MKSISIQTSNNSVIDAIRAIIALDPETTMVYDDEPSLSEAYIRDLGQIIEADKRSEIQYIPFEQFDRDMRSFLKSLRA